VRKGTHVKQAPQRKQKPTTSTLLFLGYAKNRIINIIENHTDMLQSVTYSIMCESKTCL